MVRAISCALLPQLTAADAKRAQARLLEIFPGPVDLPLPLTLPLCLRLALSFTLSLPLVLSMSLRLSLPCSASYHLSSPASHSATALAPADSLPLTLPMSLVRPLQGNVLFRYARRFASQPPGLVTADTHLLCVRASSHTLIASYSHTTPHSHTDTLSQDLLAC